MDNNKLIILFTSTINPNDFSFVGRKKIEDRLSDYILSYKFYSNKGYRIFWVDNSNFDIDPIKKDFKVTDFFSFPSVESFKGKGHGEFEIMNQFFIKNDIIDSGTVVVKISGRFIIENFDDIISKISDFSNYHYCNFSRDLFWADTRLMILSKDFYYRFFKPKCIQYLDENNGVFFEKVYARAIHQWMAEGGRIKLLPEYPLYKGYNGVTNRKIQFNLFSKIKYQVYYTFKKFIFRQTI